jgi:hypothetical protein
MEFCVEVRRGGTRSGFGESADRSSWQANAIVTRGRLSMMAYRPTSRMDALLEELCTMYRWCLNPEDRGALVAAGLQDREEIADSIIRAEFGETGVQDKSTRAFLMPIVDDWLFDSAGRGARSRLPL